MGRRKVPGLALDLAGEEAGSDRVGLGTAVGTAGGLGPFLDPCLEPDIVGRRGVLGSRTVVEPLLVARAGTEELNSELAAVGSEDQASRLVQMR